MNRADITAALAVIERTAAIAGLPAATVRQLEGTRAWLLVQAGQGPPAAELDAMMARYAAAGDTDAQANLLTTIAFTAFLAGRPEQALEFMRTRDKLIAGRDSFSSRVVLAVPARHVRAGRRGAGGRPGGSRSGAAAGRGTAGPVAGPVPGFRGRRDRVCRRRLGRRGCRAGRGAGAGGGDRHRVDLAAGRLPVLHRRAPRPHRPGPGPAGVLPPPRPAAAVRARPPRLGRAGRAGSRRGHRRGGRAGPDAVVRGPGTARTAGPPTWPRT